MTVPTMIRPEPLPTYCTRTEYEARCTRAGWTPLSDEACARGSWDEFAEGNGGFAHLNLGRCRGETVRSERLEAERRAYDEAPRTAAEVEHARQVAWAAQQPCAQCGRPSVVNPGGNVWTCARHLDYND